MAVGAAIGVRLRRPVLAVPLAFVSHFVLEAIPHLNVGWINGFNVSAAADLGLGLVLSLIVARKVGHAWPLIGAFAAVLPDAPGIRDVVEAWVSQVLPHATWFSPWGIATEALVTALALYWAVGGTAG